MTQTQTLDTNTVVTPPQTREKLRTSLHSLKAYVLGLGLLVFGLGPIGMEPASANPANHNAGLMAWMTLQPNQNNLAITLENTAESKQVGNVDIKPTTNHLTIGLEGQIQAEQEEFGVNQTEIPEVILASDHYGQSFLHWGTVFLDGMEVKATEILASQPYQPAYWLHNIEWTMQSSSHEPFLVPLDSIKDGSADIRFRPVEEFNNLVDTWVQEGGSRLLYLRQDHEFTVMRPVSLSGTVIDHVAFNPEGGPIVEGAGYHTEMMPITVKYIGDPDLMADLPDQGPDDKAVPFQVTTASVVTQLYDLNYEGQCPTELDFGLTIHAVGQGMVEYRLVDKLGAKGPINTMWFENGGSQLEIFSKQVTDGNSVGGFDGTLTGNGHGGFEGFSNDKGIEETDQQHGSWRVEIVSPNHFTSAEHFYHWTCTTTLNERG